MIAGAVSNKYRYVLEPVKPCRPSQPDGYPQHLEGLVTEPARNPGLLVNFRISKNELSMHTMLDSAFSSPARYLLEMYRRLKKLSGFPDEEIYVVFNPRFHVNAFVLQAVISFLSRRKIKGETCVVGDKKNNPVAYLFSGTHEEFHEKYLTLLSLVDARLDAHYLGFVFSRPVRVLNCKNVKAIVDPENGFTEGAGLKMLCRWPAEHACRWFECVETEAGVKHSLSGEEAAERLKGLPVSAVMPYFAGDVLFCAIAAREIKSLFDALIVCESYIDILSSVDHKLASRALERPVWRRNPIKEEDEMIYYKDLLNALPDDSLHYNMRVFRKYENSDHHLIDQAAFALGASMTNQDELVTRKRERSNHRKPLKRAEQGWKVLLYFDGGWDLKVYPVELQYELINRLRQNSVEVTVLSNRENCYDGVKVAAFQSLEQLQQLILDQHIIVGMDSFPIHFSEHVIGRPSICLFGSTKPANSDSFRPGYYKALENGMSCRPCSGQKSCHRYKLPYCRNFVSPDAVSVEVFQMLSGIYENGQNANRG